MLELTNPSFYAKAMSLSDEDHLHHRKDGKTNCADCIPRHKHNGTCRKNYPFSPSIPSDNFFLSFSGKE